MNKRSAYVICLTIQYFGGFIISLLHHSLVFWLLVCEIWHALSGAENCIDFKKNALKILIKYKKNDKKIKNVQMMKTTLIKTIQNNVQV